MRVGMAGWTSSGGRPWIEYRAVGRFKGTEAGYAKSLAVDRGDRGNPGDAGRPPASGPTGADESEGITGRVAPVRPATQPRGRARRGQLHPSRQPRGSARGGDGRPVPVGPQARAARPAIANPA